MAAKKYTLSRLRRQEAAWSYAFLLPAFLTILIFVFIPVINAFWISMHKWSMFGDMKWVGLGNYTYWMKNDEWLATLKKTFRYVLVYMPSLFCISLMLALIVKHIYIGTGFFRTAYFMPIVLSATASGIVWKLLFDQKAGAINKIIKLMGGSAIPWLGRSQYAIWAALIVHIWMQSGYYMVIFYAGIQDIPRDYYEAAEIDGATGWNAFRYITFPCLSNTSAFVLIMSAINSFQAFDQVKMLTNGGPAYATRFAVHHIYENAFQLYDMGGSTSMAIILFAIVLVVSILQLRVTGQTKK